MPTPDTVTTAVSIIGAGTLGTVAVEVLRGRRESKRDDVAVPALAESTISAGAKDAVEAIKTTLGELRTDLSEQRAKCDNLEERLAASEEKLTKTQRALAEEQEMNRVLLAEVEKLKERLAEYDQRTG